MTGTKPRRSKGIEGYRDVPVRTERPPAPRVGVQLQVLAATSTRLESRRTITTAADIPITAQPQQYHAGSSRTLHTTGRGEARPTGCRSRTGAPCNKGVGDVGTGPNSRTEQNARAPAKRAAHTTSHSVPGDTHTHRHSSFTARREGTRARPAPRPTLAAHSPLVRLGRRTRRGSTTRDLGRRKHPSRRP